MSEKVYDVIFASNFFKFAHRTLLQGSRFMQSLVLFCFKGSKVTEEGGGGGGEFALRSVRVFEIQV